MQGIVRHAGMPGARADTSGVPVNRTEAERLGITFARAPERPVRSSVRAVGTLKYAEAQPRVRQRSGRRLGGAPVCGLRRQRVEQGEPVLALYSPDLVSAPRGVLCWRGD